jgi:SWI/SNF-related matrix-associated actin-dependent regulator of chromatin subfamily A3
MKKKTRKDGTGERRKPRKSPFRRKTHTNPRGFPYAHGKKNVCLEHETTMSTLDYSQDNFPYKGIKTTEKFITEPFRHQAETIEWMMFREEIPFDNVRGGLVLLEMGLGKSFCALSCVVLAGGLTLVIVPAQLVYVWESEINRHFKDLSYFIYHGANRGKRFQRYKLINGNPLIFLMSFQSVAADIEDPASPLRNIDFHRIIFDECHYIKNQHTAVFKAVSRIKSPVKWFLSGTPVMNKIQEMYPYLKLLNYKHVNRIPQAELRGRNGLAIGGYPGGWGDSHGNKDGRIDKDVYARMQELLGNIAIRRMKNVLDLPEKNYKDVLVPLSPEERNFYRQLTAYSTNRLRKLMRNLKRIQNSGLTPQEQARMRVLILQSLLSLIFHLRLACCDPLMVIDKIPRTKDMDMKLAIEELKKEGSATDCRVCYNNEATVLNTDCRHVACSECWKKLAKMNPMRCFQCVDFAETSSVYLQDNSTHEREGEKESHNKRIVFRSSKTRAVLDIVAEELKKGNKVVVVSQWTTYLAKLVHQFKCENRNVPFIVLDGSVMPMKRQKMVDEFQDKNDLLVCFASLGSSAEGITLHSACSMVICDVYWNKAKIEQISDRIHRIGQVKTVSVYCIYVENSIEMKLKDLVDKKDVICKVIVDCAPITHAVDSWLTRMIKLIDG